MENKYKTSAKVFCDAIRRLSENPAALENLELYLSNHFDTWTTLYAYTPETLSAELREFSRIEF